MAFVFNLANDPDVRRMSFHSEEISWETHQAWFARQLREGNPFYIATLNGKPCGYVRMQRDILVPAEEAVVTIAVAPAFRGRGIATAALRMACKRALSATWVRRIWGMVKTANIGSRKVFAAAFFQEAGNRAVHGADVVCFVYPGCVE